MKDTLKRIFTNRILYVALFMIVSMSVLCVRLYNLQIVDGDKHRENAQKGDTYSIELKAPRGNIYDCNGVLLATNRTAYEVLMVNARGEQSERDKMYLDIINIFEKNKDIYNNPLRRYLSSPTEWGYSIDEEGEAEARSSWINDMALKKADRENLATAEGAFDYLRNTVFGLDKKYTDSEAYKIMCIRYETYTNGLDSLRPTTIATDCCEATMQEFSSRYLEFPGISTEKVYFREYVNTECISQVIGYVRSISSEEYEQMKDQGYGHEDVIGKNGIEKSAENYLRGTKGTRVVSRDTNGIIREVSYTAPVAGNDVYLTIDIELQRIAYNSLEENIKDIASKKNNVQNFGDCNAGTMIVSDINTGAIKAMASYPGYDNSIFVQPASDQEAQKKITELFQDPDSPSLNRATQGLYAVGSTFKPIVAIAGLESGVITPDTEFRCTGEIKINNMSHKCLQHHGYTDLSDAIAHSCNIYFYNTGMKAGIKKIDEVAKKFGLGQKTGIELAEFEGNRSNPETMALKEQDLSHVWTDSDTAQTAIGQLYTLFTPLQMNRYVAAVGNGGYLNTPHVIDSVSSASGSLVFKTEVKQTKIDVSPWALKQTQNGMHAMGTINGSMKTTLKNFPLGFASAKTGTVEAGDSTASSNSAFICYAPSEKPEMAVSVVLEHGVYGGYSIPTIGNVFEEYFGPEYKISSTQAELNRVWPSASNAQNDGTSWGYNFSSIMSVIGNS